jgi:hypothetical protein
VDDGEQQPGVPVVVWVLRGTRTGSGWIGGDLGIGRRRPSNVLSCVSRLSLSMSVLLRRGGAVKYALLIYGSRSATDDRADEELRDISEGYAEIFKLAVVSSGTQLQPVETATSVRVDDGRTVLYDGPLVDGEEVLVGSFLFEGHDLDEAIEVAARIPAARIGGGVEVRPIVE